MSLMFSNPTMFIMLVSGIIVAVTVFGAMIWAIYHVLSGRFHVKYEEATVQKASSDTSARK